MNRRIVEQTVKTLPALPFQNLVQLRLSENRRFLVTADGAPFSWFGDTAWELFHRANREEAEYYLKKRADQGFTVIQAVVLAEFQGIREPNAYGDLPLVDQDPERPDEAYFRHVDWIVTLANRLGLIIGILPTWGDKVGKDAWRRPTSLQPQERRDLRKISWSAVSRCWRRLDHRRRPRRR